MQRQGIMLAYPYEERRLTKWPRPFIVQPKLDGDRCRAIPLENRWILVSSEGNEITSVSHILEQLNAVPRHSWMELDGELYNHSYPHNTIHSIVSRTVNPHPYFTLAEFHIFDMVSETLPQMERLDLLKHFFDRSKEAGNTHILPVSFKVAITASEIMDHYFSYIDEGYEGIIVRNLTGLYQRKRSTDLMKFKPKKSDWYKIIGYKEEVDKHGRPKDRLGALLCGDDMGSEFSVGSGFTDSQREDLWPVRDSLIGCFAQVKYQHLISKSQIPRFPIFVEIDEESGE